LTATSIGLIIRKSREGLAMAWYDRFGKYRNAEELRWIVFILAAITGLLIILMTAGLG
jgi:hypothetical protein